VVPRLAAARRGDQLGHKPTVHTIATIPPTAVAGIRSGDLRFLGLDVVVAPERANARGPVRDPTLVDAHILYRLAQHAVHDVDRAVGRLRQGRVGDLAAVPVRRARDPARVVALQVAFER
jgi:hypothetical protein